MKLYVYNINNKNEYITTEEIELAEGQAIEPPYTDVVLPEAITGKCWCFDAESKAWNSAIDDFRGATIYNKGDSFSAQTVKFVGDIKPGYTLIAPPDTKNRYCFVNDAWIKIIEPKIFSKLSIRRVCRSLGLEAKLDALLNSNAVFKADWDDAGEIDLADEITSNALHTHAFTDDEYDAILNALGGVQ